MKPMLSYTIDDTSKLLYPLLASAKLDGVRALVINGVVMSRSLKPIRNKHVQKLFGIPELEGCDGELIVGPANSDTVYRVTSSGVMSEGGEPEVTFHLFDRYDKPSLPFKHRYEMLPKGVPNTVLVKQHVVTCENTLLALEGMYLNEGFEGLMVRNDSSYKFGRSTAREGALGKLKRFQDDEFKVVGFVERMHNANEAKINELGRTERSTHKENLVGRGDLGALVLEMSDGKTFTCGTGFSDEDRAHIWQNRDGFLGALAKVKHFAYGTKDVVRFPTFLGFRDKEDM